MKNVTIKSAAISWCVVLGNAFISSGCEPVMVVGTGAAVTTSVAEERGIGGVLSDSSIKTRIQVRYMENNPELARNVDVVVRQGRVLLTGTLSNPRLQIDAVRLAWKVDGVQEVIDETSIGGSSGIGTYANDSWITTQVKSKMIFDKNIQSLNYNIQSIKGTVYIMGIAQSQRELDQVIDIARRTSKVRKVISYVTLKPKSVTAQSGQKEHIVRPPSEDKRAHLAPIEYGNTHDLSSPHHGKERVEDVEIESLDEPNNDSAFQ